jgi:hypothetical protein
MQVKEVLTAIASKSNSLLLVKAKSVEEYKGSITDEDMQAIMELQLWPEIKALLVTELDLIANRFPSPQSYQTSMSLSYLAHDLVFNALKDPSYGLSPTRLDEITRICELHTQKSRPETSELSKEMQSAQDDLRVLEAIQMQLAELSCLELQF